MSAAGSDSHRAAGGALKGLLAFVATMSIGYLTGYQLLRKVTSCFGTAAICSDCTRVNNC